MGLPGSSRSAAGLSRVRAAQMRAIPFEAIDPLLDFTPDLTNGAISEKLLRGGPGGYRLELNLLLETALMAPGFAPRRRLARVRVRGARTQPRTLQDAQDLRAVLCDRLGLRLTPHQISEIWRRIDPSVNGATR